MRSVVTINVHTAQLPLRTDGSAATTTNVCQATESTWPWRCPSQVNVDFCPAQQHQHSAITTSKVADISYSHNISHAWLIILLITTKENFNS